MTKLQPRPRAVVRVPASAIRPNPRQPRLQCDPEGIRALAESIRRHGLLTPLLVRAIGGGQYELIAGQRRLMALRALERCRVDAIVLSADDCDSALIALVENLQREPLHFLDEAEACRRILEAHPITQERLAASLSISSSALANRLRLLKLPPQVRDAVRQGGLTERHARALLRLEDESSQLELVRQIAAQKLSVKQAEDRIAQRLAAHPHRRISAAVRDHRVVVNAVMDTVRELKRIGIPIQSRIDERDDRIEVVVTIPLVLPKENEGTDRSRAL